MRNHVSDESMKSTRDIFVLTHDAKLKSVTHEGVGSFQSLLKHWKSVHAMKNLELCYKCVHGIIDDTYHFNKVLERYILDLGLPFNDARTVTDTSCIKSYVKLRTKKIIAHCNRISEKVLVET